MQKTVSFLLQILLLLPVCYGYSFKDNKRQLAPQWEEISLSFSSEFEYHNPYMDVEMHAVFIHDNGTTLVRPAFWDGGNTWKIRFASPLDEGNWRYTTYCSDQNNTGLHNQKAVIEATGYEGNNNLIKNGFLKMSPGHRNIIHANGHPFVLAADTPWALPFRGTIETVGIYAADRQEKGFNAALLMSLMPDREVEGPRDRESVGGFDVAFEDLPEGHITRMNISYFQYLDKLIDILIDHGIVPVYQPVFHGWGWKGGNALGRDMDPVEYAGYCRYLVARYGARPSIWLVCGDGYGNNPGVKEGGEEIGKWDAYRHPAGLHYNPFDFWCPEGWGGTECFHENSVHQDAWWLDFQWCQTGHEGEHLPEKVYRMYYNEPVKGVANGESSYEAMGEDQEKAAGWWQGHQAWLQFTSGGTMGHVYGAGALWNWKLFPDEPGWTVWADGNDLSWKEALDLEGANYVGIFGRILRNYDITDIQLRHDLAGGELMLARPGELYICYLPEGGPVSVEGVGPDLPYRWYDPKSGERGEELQTRNGNFSAPGNGPRVLIIGSPFYKYTTPSGTDQQPEEGPARSPYMAARTLESDH